MTKPTYIRSVSISRFIAYLMFVVLIGSVCGCQLAPKEKPTKWPWQKEDNKALPDRILPVFTESVLHQPNQPGVRGFGGRIYFYAKENTDPIEINGSLAVYVFDAEDIDLNSQKPLRKYMFTTEQFAEHMSKTSIGPSYSIWLPWGEIGGPPRKLSLIARFEGHEGGTVISDPTIKLLPGVPTKEQDEEPVSGTKASSTSPFRLSGHQKKFEVKGLHKNSDDESESSGEPVEEPRSDIKTIDLPPSFQRHLRGSSMEVPQAAASQSTLTQVVPTTPGWQVDSAEGANAPRTVQTSSEQNSQPSAASPMTTQVYDYRTRKGQGATTFNSPKNDIRQGRWINSIARDH